MQLQYNDYVPYYSIAAEKATEICKGLTTEKQKFDKICKWITSNIVYDYIKALVTPKTQKAGTVQLPDVQNCFMKKRGICSDISALTCSMMRAQGLEAYYVTGKVYYKYMGVRMGFAHAWVEVKIDNEIQRFDLSANQMTKKRRDTLEYYKKNVY